MWQVTSVTTWKIGGFGDRADLPVSPAEVKTLEA